jgi:uncharacterized protein YpiB (UPF0302 family)
MKRTKAEMKQVTIEEQRREVMQAAKDYCEKSSHTTEEVRLAKRTIAILKREERTEEARELLSQAYQAAIRKDVSEFDRLLKKVNRLLGVRIKL